MTKADGELRRYQRPRLRYGSQRAVPQSVPGRSLPACRPRTTCRQPTDPARVYIAVMTRQQTWGKALTLAEATADAAAFARRFSVLEDGPSVWDQLMELSRRYSFWRSSGP
jgi:hypothetical protein